MSNPALQPVKILLVEDNLQDIEIARRAFSKGKVKNELIVVRDGLEALDYLHHQGKYSDPASSHREEDVVKAYRLGVNTYIQKPVEFDQFMRVVHAVQEYWIVIASIPPTG